MHQFDRPPPWSRGQGWAAMWVVIAQAIKGNATTARLCVIILVLGVSAFAATILLHMVWPIMP